jgi:hypothetical protein
MPAEPNVTLARRAIAEVLELHALLEAWLGGGAPGDLGRLEAALAPDFRMVPPGGALLGREQVLAMLTDARAARGASFHIVVDEADAVEVGDDLCLVTYVERQAGPDGPTSRRSSALLRDAPGAPNDVQWLHLHETWIGRR